MDCRLVITIVSILTFLATSILAQESESKKVGELRYSGVVYPMRRVTMQPNMSVGQSARVVKVNFEEGDIVKKGQILVQLDDREPIIVTKIAEQQVEQDKVTMAGLKRQLEYQKQELDRMITGGTAFAAAERDKAQYNYDLAKIQYEQHQATLQAHLLQLEQAKTRLDDYYIRAPFDGVITMKGVEEGQTVENTSKVLEVMEVSSVLVSVNVENEYFHGITEGDKVTVTVEALPGRTFEAVVHSKGPIADPRSKTFVVKIKIDNKDNAIKPGWYADVVFPAKVAEKKVK